MIAASPTKVIYAGDGITTAFGFSMQLPSGSVGAEIQVYVFDNLGNQTLLTGNYTVTVNENGIGGTVNYPTVGGVSPLGVGVNALPQAWQIVLARVVPLSQLLSIITQGIFSGTALTAALDYLMMAIQQMQEQLNRATLVPINTPGPAQAVAVPTVSPLALVQVTGTWAQLVAYAVAAPTVQFLGFVNSGDQNGSQFLYTGNVAYGNQGFITLGGG